MKLNRIVLTGFKSFAKRTVFEIEDGIIAVVGPNGCGKSNIIDALRWTMGESRASQLRQEVSSDIIFNGASRHRAADWCSVELQLINDKSRELGLWNDYAELSVRRQLERHGDSNYSINGQKVRRRDVVDLFAGTGSGARSYGIVEQERITSVIRADPQRIRGYLEEAAGVAIYKDRRRETENRIRDAEANMLRIGDNVQELERQLTVLEKQAKSTAMIRKAKNKLEIANQLDLIMRHEDLKAKYEKSSEEVLEFSKASNSAKTNLASIEEKLSKSRAKRQATSTKISQLHSKHYASMADMERAQQELKDYELQTENVKKMLAEADELTQGRAKRCDDLIVEKKDESGKREQFAITLQKIQASSKKADEQLIVLMQQASDTQKVRSEAEASGALLVQAQHENKTFSEIIEHRIKDCEKGMSAFEHELQSLAKVEKPNDEDLVKLKTQTAAARQDALANEQKRQETVADASDVKEQIVRFQGEIGGLGAEYELLQQVAQRFKEKNAPWFTKHGLSDAKLLVNSIGIKAPGLEKAVDAVIGPYLQGYVTDNLDANLLDDQLPKGLVLIDSQTQATSVDHANIPQGLKLLANEIIVDEKWQKNINSWLCNVFVAQDYTVALKVAPALTAGQKVVTGCGTVFSSNTVVAPYDQKSGVEWNARLQRTSKKITSTKAQVEQSKLRLSELEATIEKLANSGSQLASTRESYEQKLQDAQQEYQRLIHAAEYYATQSALLESKIKQLGEQKTKQQEQLKQANSSLKDAKEKVQSNNAALEVHRQACEKANKKIEDQRELCRNLATDLSKADLDSNLNKQRLGDIDVRLVELQLALADSRTNIVKYQEALKGRNIDQLTQSLKSSKVVFEKTRKDVEQAEEQSSSMDKKILDFEAELQIARIAFDQLASKLRDLELIAATKKTEAAVIERSIKDRSVNQEKLQQLRERYIDVEATEKLITSLQKRIENAGPINYAVESEYQECEQRLEELTKQQDDLTNALQTLQSAIKRIDKEMLGRIKEIYAKVNVKFDELFKKLFDGGSAYLEVDSEDFLSANMLIRVCPPGKRVVNIQSLSGGEKTLTALAFIFALNELNPPPYCVLDEVDAALDESNTMRYCRLIESMKDRTQFILVTHNKQVIEQADWLVGVTQEEKGITKLITVCLDDALAQAKAVGGVVG